MTISNALTAAFQSLGIISILLILGALLRAKIPFFQNLYLPSCVIGGFIGLILGPNALNILRFSEDTMTVASALPNLLIIPVLAVTPMGLKLFKGKSKSSDALSKSNDVLVLSFLTAGFLILQLAVGCGVTLVCKAFGANTFDGMGLEMGAGFAGGHGTAASIGSSFEELGNPNWEAALGGGMTTATVGVIGGILIGTALINYAARHGYTTQIKSAAETPLEMRTGFYEKGMERPSMGPQTTVSNSIETLTLHLGLLLIATFLAYPFSTLCKMTGISLFSSIPTWLYGMIVMLILWSAISFLKLDYLFDDAVKNKVTGLLSDYMITAAIMSISLSVVLTYWVVLVAVIVAGLILVPVLNWFICKKMLCNNWFEKSLGILGANLGVYVTGMLLIKMADPDLKSDALSDYSVGYTLGSLVVTPILAIAIGRAATVGTASAFVWCALVSLVIFAAMFIVNIFTRRKKAA